MIRKAGPLLVCSVLLAIGASCGFKSDLYLPGQPQELGQYDSKSLKDLGDEKLRQLQIQTDGNAPVSPAASDDVSSGGESSAGVGSGIPVDGVVVELPTAEELVQDNSDQPKKTGNGGAVP